MRTITLICAILLGCSWSYGQSAVAFCSLTQVYAFCYGGDNPAQCARNTCLEKGGKVPNVFSSTERHGYGAIATGKDSDGRTFIGAGCGYDDAKDASDKARSECAHWGAQGIQIVETWYDAE